MIIRNIKLYTIFGAISKLSNLVYIPLKFHNLYFFKNHISFRNEFMLFIYIQFEFWNKLVILTDKNDGMYIKFIGVISRHRLVHTQAYLAYRVDSL